MRVLADGRLHSGTSLANGLGVTRSAIWKQIGGLRRLGLEVDTRAARGYCLGRPLELLDARHIRASLATECQASCDDLQVVWVVDSTSSLLARLPPPEPGKWRAVLAEYQTGGRGRHGRRWHSAFGSGLCLSLAVGFGEAPRDLPTLSLAAGIGVVRALEAMGARGLSVKWPNDVLFDQAKLAGVLVEVDGDSRGPLRVIVGMGLNLFLPTHLSQSIAAEGGLQPGALEAALPGRTRVARNDLAALLISTLWRILRDFPQSGFGPMVDEWRAHDALAGRAVRIHGGGDTVTGIAAGIGADGSLLVDTPGRRVAVFNGDVTLRGEP